MVDRLIELIYFLVVSPIKGLAEPLEGGFLAMWRRGFAETKDFLKRVAFRPTK